MNKLWKRLIGYKEISTPLYFDGGTGTMLQKAGLKAGELPEMWNITHKDEVVALHKAYLGAGANIIKTNTFGAYESKFPEGTALPRVEQVVSAAVHNARRAIEEIEREAEGTQEAAGEHYIALDIGPCGKLLRPMGDLDFEDAVTLFKRTIAAGLAAGVDAILIETMNDCYEAKAAVVAAKEAMVAECSRKAVYRGMEELSCELPILVTTVYDESGRALTGATPEAMAAILEGLGVAALGMNCSLGPRQMLPLVKRLAKCTSVPIIVNPNAGLPRTENGKTVYDVGAAEFACIMQEIVQSGAAIVGGCCGTTPEYIRETVARCKGASGDSTHHCNDVGATVIASYTRTVTISSPMEGAPVLIGERINPTGKKRFKEALRAGDVPYIVQQGLEQEEAGAHVLDVNVGLPEIDEKAMMVKAVEELQSVCTLPLQIDTSSPAVMEAALRRYNGKALVNSVNGKAEVMDAVFPIVKKYGGVVVALTIDEDGIPPTAEGRVDIARRIYERAAHYGIRKCDIVIDPLAMAVSADNAAARETLRAVRMINEAGGRTILGVSNISFGLPNRELVSSAFFTMAMQCGLSCAIMNPLSKEMMRAYACYCLLAGFDENAAKYIEFAQGYAGEHHTDGGAVGEPCRTITNTSRHPEGGVANPSRHPEDGIAASPRHPEGGIAARGNLVEGRDCFTGSQGGRNRNDEGLQSNDNIRFQLTSAIARGLKAEAARLTEAVLSGNGGNTLDVIDGCLIPALDDVGKRFEDKTLYLPQLLMSAEAASAAFAVIKEQMAKEKGAGQSSKQGGKHGGDGGGERKVIIATVKGDIHDIGKNIVKALLENYGFCVIDLGKDVPPETVVNRCAAEHVMLVGLSALMTTTVPAMEETIKQLRKKAPWAKVCVGGAVMTEEYAAMIGADFYGKDAMATVRYAREVLP